MPSRSTYLPNLTGHTIDHGMLKLVKRMGRGAFGQVYMAENFGSSGPSFYAVKCLQRTAHGSRDAKMQERERRFHLRVSPHPNIVTFHGTLVDQEHRFFVLELCTGSDMHDAIIRGVYHRKTAMIKRVFAAVIDAILFCHSHGIYHRDLKPENILVDSDGENPRIADFGLSTDQRVSHEMSCGSPSYMPPESFASASSFYRPADNDTWALCIVLLNMLACMNPWHGAEPSDARWNAFMANPDYLRGIAPVSRPLNDYFKQCFRVDPTSRPSLLEVKDAVLDMRHLYMSDADFKVARYSVQRIAEGAAFGENIPYQRSACSHCGGHADASDSGSGSSGYSSATRVERPITFPEDEPKTMAGASHLAVPGHTLSNLKAPVSSRPSSNAIFAPRVHDVSPMASSLEDQLAVFHVIIASEPKASRSKLKGFMHRLRVWRK
ncbi:protein serine threonine kinase [Favolaschia claudopus]|uniref:Protein serine threonine kinase n=1 Tax=Favolaschia claudopus TaxID=2862362 RepID=A0AAW0DW89_9AGAR